MYFRDALASSFATVLNHKMRSFLTLLGIMIGVAAVVSMFSTVEGIKSYLTASFKAMGWNNSVLVTPKTNDDNTHSFFQNWMVKRAARPLTLSDYEFLKNTIKCKYSYGMIEQQTRMYVNNKPNWVSIKATSADYFKVHSYPLAKGRNFNKFEEFNGPKVCILGYLFSQEHFPGTDPLDKIIDLGGIRYKVIGILGRDILNSGGSMNFNTWERREALKAVYIPLGTGASYYRANKSVDYFNFQAADDSSYARMYSEIRQKFLAHRNWNHDFSFSDIGSTMMKITQELNGMLKKWNATLLAIASISLLVGGIGLFSTLLISINERMLEIGVRKSLGSTESGIFLYFVMEAMVLAVLGALIGIGTSAGLIFIIGKIVHIAFPLPAKGIMLGIGFSLLIGILSGLYPALKAAKIDPIKAIYYYE